MLHNLTRAKPLGDPKKDAGRVQLACPRVGTCMHINTKVIKCVHALLSLSVVVDDANHKMHDMCAVNYSQLYYCTLSVTLHFTLYIHTHHAA